MALKTRLQSYLILLIFLLSMLGLGCGGGGPQVLKYKDFEFFWRQGTNLVLGKDAIPEGATLEIHPTFILVESKDDWKILIPMENIRFINVK